MKSSNRANGEVRCFLCFNPKLQEYHLQLEEFLNFVLKRKIFLENHDSHLINKEKEKLSNNIFNSLKTECNKLIKPCKCDTYAHIQCLIQYCILHFTLKCDECQSEYSLEFHELNESNEKTFFIIKATLFFLIHIILLIVSILFCVFRWIPRLYDFWNFFFGISLLILNSVVFYGFIKIVWEKFNLINNNTFPFFINNNSNSNKNSDNKYNKFGIFLKRALMSTIEELVERKINSRLYIYSTLNSQRQLNEYINNNNNEMFDSNSEQVKEELKEDLENKFHGAQIIKSTLIENEGININNHNNNNNEIHNEKTYQYIEKKFPKSLTKTGNTGTSHEIPRKKIVHRIVKSDKNNNVNNNNNNNNNININNENNDNNIENKNNEINNNIKNNELIDDETKRNNNNNNTNTNNNLITNENNSNPKPEQGDDLLNLNVKKDKITNGFFKEGDATIEEQAAKKLLKN
jgi:hypothetical protein